MTIKQEKYRFTVGALDPKLFTRSDTEFYESGAKTMRNVLCLPEGGFIARPGSVFIKRLPRQLTRLLTASMTITMPNGGSTTLINDGDESTFSTTGTNLSTTNGYVVAQYDLGSIKNIAFVDLVNVKFSSATGLTDEFAVKISVDGVIWTTAGTITLSETEQTKRLNLIVNNQGTARYIRFIKNTADDMGTLKVTLSEMNVFEELDDISNVKRIDFVFNADQAYVIFLTDKNIRIFRNDIIVADVRALNYINDVVPLVYSTQTADTAITFHSDVQTSSLIRTDDTTWNLGFVTFQNRPYYNFTTKSTSGADTLTPSETSGKVTLTAGSGIFTAADVEQYVDGNGGRARIVSLTSATVVEAIVEIPFYNTNAIPAGDWFLESGYELEWSDTRGWPVCGEFFQQRLNIGGSKSRPRTFYQSRIGEFYDFDIGSLRDDDATKYDLDSDEPIVSIVGNRNLQVFTTGAELADIQSRFTPSTINNFNLLSQTRIGSKPGIKPVVADGATLFLQRGGHSIGSYVYTEAEQAYDTTNLTFLSSHLIKDPVDIALRKSTNAEEASYLMIVNSDGTMAFGCILGEQGVKGFTEATTDGLYKAVAVEGDKMYAVVQRTINGQDNLLVERFDFDVDTDSSVVSTTLGTDTVFFTSHLVGKTIRIVADGNVLPDQTVTGTGFSVTLPRVADNKKLGLNIDLLYESLPYKNPQVLGPGLHYKYRLSGAHIYLQNTGSISVNGKRILLQDLGDNNPLDAQAPLRTGVFDVEGEQGWDSDAALVITRPDPLPFGILGYSTTVEVGARN